MKYLYLSIITLLSFITLLSHTDSQATEINFPQHLTYKVFKNGIAGGQATLAFKKHQSKRGPVFRIKLFDFEGLGFKSDQYLITDIDQNNLTLLSSKLFPHKRANMPIFEAMASDGSDSILGNSETVYRYATKGGGGVLETGLYSNYRVIDLLSSFVVASDMVRVSKKQKKEHFDFLIKEKVKNVEMTVSGKKEQIKLEGEIISTTPVSLQYTPKGGTPKQLYTFYIHNSKFFPVKIAFPFEGGTLVELKHKK
ncbi:MAG: hypothetical protein D3905_12010 [Candidatus Electrothrix sp. AS4_5]|nr:hypothetical protein [Candidatus Electrothrix gigas]MCI5190485.1 hypothetical protein [Candidatus Electrothrix gigas]